VADLSSNPDNLIPFLELVAANQKANIANFPGPYQLIRRVNICLSTASKHLINPGLRGIEWVILGGISLENCAFARFSALLLRLESSMNVGWR
jgi:hypothetical protein